MTSIRRFAKNVENRKELVKKISSITGITSRYTGMPRMAYEIGNFLVEKDGTLAVTMTEDGNEGAVILALKADSMIGDELPSTTEAITASETRTPPVETDTETTAQITHSDDEEADNDPAYSSVEDIDEEETDEVADSSVADTETEIGRAHV